MKDWSDFKNSSSLKEAVSQKNGFLRKKENILISMKDLEKFFAKYAGEEFKSLNKDFLKVFNDHFDIQIGAFRTDEKTFMSERWFSMMKGKSFIINQTNKGKAVSTTATTVAKLSKEKIKKYKIPQGKSDKLDKFVKTVVVNMLGSSKGRLLLTGDPGTGKTNTVEAVMSLLKLNIMTIEAPHVSEENIISVPYLVRRGATEENNTMEFKSVGSSFEVVNAESNLITQLRQAKPIRDSEYEKFLSQNKYLRPLAAKYAKVIEDRIPYTNVLFIDETFRTGSPRIQNLFRTIMNGKIGTTKIPSNTYIIYASNMDNSDGSLDTIPLNQQFNEVEFDKPSKDDFMRYMANKFTTADPDTGEELNTNETSAVNELDKLVYNTFADELSDEEMGSKDMTTEAEIRVSPRRWEEIIKYINANIPVDDVNEASRLLTFLKDNMSDYTTNETSVLYDKYKKVLLKLIAETSDVDVSDVAPIDNKNWRNNFEGQLAAKLKMGKDRKYIPIISGKPGLGKTAMIDDITEKYGLKKIIIDASVLESEDVIGLTTPTTSATGTITTEFTTPPLFRMIMDEYDPDKELINGQKYTHVLFIDELSRTKTKVFNGLRALMLEKKVGQEKIPEDIMIVGAMNPFDAGTTLLTDHLKDVVDVVQAEGNINESYKFFESTKMYENGNHTLGIKLSDVLLNFFKDTLDTFRSEVNTDGEDVNLNDSSFYWTDGLNVVYISPREFDDLIVGTINDSLTMLDIEYGFDSPENFAVDDVDAYVGTISDVIIEKYHNTLKFIESKHGLDDFMVKFDTYIETSANDYRARLKDEFTTIVSQATNSFLDIFRDSTSIQQMIDTPNIGGLLENIIENSDVNDVITDIDTIISESTHQDNVASIFETVIDTYTLLSTVDWTRFNSEITANISSTFVDTALKPTAERLKAAIIAGDDIPGYETYDDYMEAEIGADKMATLDVMFASASTNKNNMFV